MSVPDILFWLKLSIQLFVFVRWIFTFIRC